MKQLKTLKPLHLFLYYFFFAIGMLLVRLLYPIRALGKENLRVLKGEGFVLAPNHLYAIDPMFVVLARGFAKKMLIMGKEELFHINPLLNFFWKMAGVFPVHRGTGDTAALEKAVMEVKAGRGLLIFPEGTRSKDGKLGRLKSGSFVVAAQADACMVPCRIWYKAGRPKMFNRITVVFGKPVPLAELGLTDLPERHRAAALRDVKRLFAARLEELWEQNKDKL